MRFRRRRNRCINPEATRAAREAKVELARVREKGKEVHELSEASREFRRRNHFAEDLQKLFAGGVG